MKIIGCIPARYASSRLPGKPLADLHGTPMIVHVLKQAQQAQSLSELICLTDDERIYDAVTQAGFNCAYTAADCASGTDRIIDYLRQRRDVDCVVNIQGDEVLLDPSHIDCLVQGFQQLSEPHMATLAYPCLDAAKLADPTTAKVVCDNNGDALYFSRQCLPIQQDGSLPKQALVQIGLYCYTTATLQHLAELPQSALEKVERLEQLRALQNKIPVHVFTVPSHRSLSVDTQADLSAARELLQQLKN